MTRSNMLVLIVLLCAALAVVAQSSGILQPQMKLAADAGTYDAPMGKIGDKPAEPWSATTIEAAIDKKPNAGKVVTVVGEIVDFSCYLQVGKHGEAHAACAKKCFANGQPIGLLAKNGSVYVLMEEEHHPRRDAPTTLRDAAIAPAGHVMEVTGTASSVSGQNAIFVSGFLKK